MQEEIGEAHLEAARHRLVKQLERLRAAISARPAAGADSVQDATTSGGDLRVGKEEEEERELMQNTA